MFGVSFRGLRMCACAVIKILMLHVRWLYRHCEIYLWSSLNSQKKVALATACIYRELSSGSNSIPQMC